MIDIEHLDPAVAEVVRAATVIITPVNDRDEPMMERSRHVAIDLAKLSGARLVLVDTANWTWGDTPHREGPADRDELASAGAEAAHMLAPMDEAIAAGVEVRAWRSSIPGTANYDDAVTDLAPDLAVAPSRFEHLGLLDRLRRRSPAERRHDRHPEVPMVSVEGDGTLRLL